MDRLRGAARQLGDFVLEEEIGRGGMGVVYRARQHSMGDRPVALKVLPSLIGIDESSVARFRREAEATGRLAHPGIVPVYAVGAEDGVHYFAMELIDGPSLEALLDAVSDRAPERLLGSLFEESGFDQIYPRLRDSASRASVGGGTHYARSCARIGAAVAAALAVAHREGVIHRDLKPSNVLLRPSGQPVLVDFGLARDEHMLGLTQSGDAIGTPSYMAPEQACGDRNCDGRTDVYGLGALLYEMLALRPPFSGAHPGEIMRRIVEEEPAPLRALNPRIPEDLARIVACCMAKDPDARYASVEALELDLRAFLDGRPVLARSPGRGRRLLMAARRHNRALAVGGAVLVGTSLAFAGLGLARVRADRDAGLRALDEARTHLRDGLRIEAAEEAYGRAHALLGADAVLEARESHLTEDVELLVAEQPRDGDLVAYLDRDWSRPARGADWWNKLRAHAEGRNSIGVVGLPEGARVELRAVGPGGGVDAGPLPWRQGKVLPLGEWLVQIDAPGCARSVHLAVVERDMPTLLRPLLVPAGAIADDEVLVDDPASDGGIAMRRDEISAAEYRCVLDQIGDRALARELEPVGANSADDRPVLGISWRTGRAFAIAVGAHVPSYAEYLAAATAGIAGRLHPFDGPFDWGQVAASPSGEFVRPLPVGREDRAAVSPLGIRDLVGNAADLIAPDPDGVPRAVGGSFRDDDPARLRVDSWDELEPGTPSGVLGLRLARFLPPADDPFARDAAAQLLAGVRREAPRAVVQEWTVRPDGRVDWSLALSGLATVDSGAPLSLPLATPGFRATALTVTDAYDRPLPWTDEADTGGDFRRIGVELQRRRGVQYRLAVRARLEPREALHMRGAYHRLRLPLRVERGFRALHVLRLPAGAHVDAVEPPPVSQYHDGGAPVVVWDLDADGALRSARVRFRVDGSLATPWPGFGDGVDAFRALVDGLTAGDPAARRSALEPLLDEGFVLAPQGLARDVLLAGDRAPGLIAWSGEVEDVTGVGSTVSVFARVAWGGSDGRVIRDWPVHALFERREGRLRALALGPRIAVDGGVLADRSYRHDELGLELDIPDGLTAQREAAGPWPMQLHLHESGRLRTADGPDAWVEVRGFRAPRQPEIGEMEALDRLTAGASFVTARGVIDAAFAVWESPGPDVRSRCFEAIEFDRAAGGAARVETWHLVPRGYRWFLVRAVAVGSTPDAAHGELERARTALLDPVLRGLRLHEVGKVGEVAPAEGR